MRICLFSKYGTSSNLLYEGVRQGFKSYHLPYLDININLERNEQAPHWISIPTLTQKNPKPNDKKILEKIARFKPDLILLLQYSGLPFLFDNGENLRKILREKGKIAFWLVDLAEKIYENKRLGSYIDYFFLSNAGQIKNYQNLWGVKNIYFMPQGCFFAKKFPSPQKRKYHLGFLGRRQKDDPRYKERNFILDSFKDKFGLYESDKTLNIKEIINFYQKCQIIIGSSWRNDVYLYSSDRIFNVLGSGSFYLCSYFPGIEKLFENHFHLVWFKTIEEGLKLADFYLKNDNKREKIAYNGYMLVKEKHSYKKRIKNIKDIIEGKSLSFYGYL